jgi:hypothetical protein
MLRCLDGKSKPADFGIILGMPNGILHIDQLLEKAVES